MQFRPIETLLRRRAADGPLFEVSTLVPGRMLVIGSAEIAHEILHAPSATYLAGAANRRILPLLPDDTVLTLDGEKHMARRRLLAPMLHGSALEGLAPAIAQVTAEEADLWPTHTSITMLPRLRFLALRLAANVLFGIETRHDAEVLEGLVSRALPAYGMLAGSPSLRRLRWLSPQSLTGRRWVEFADGLRDLLGERHPQVTELVGGDQLFALLLAAHETTAAALAWSVHELARAPEAAAAIAQSREGQRPWLDAVIEETLRLRAPLIDIVRTPAERVTVAGRSVEPGTLMLIPPPLIHREGGGDLLGFCPGRFLTGQPDPRTWLPFGGGDRRCLGASLALFELRHVLPLLLERFTLQPATSRSERALLYGTALVPERGARVRLTPRNAVF